MKKKYVSDVPELLEEWDWEKNELSPYEVTYGAHKKASWICKKEHHRFSSFIYYRSQGGGCPYCSGKKVIKGKTDLETLYPEIASEWDYSKNDLKPSEIAAKSGKKVHWICNKEGHEYMARVCDRVLKSRGCPYCAGQKPIKGKTDLETLYPEIASEWDYSKNDLKPSEIAAKSGKKVHWICNKEGHEYMARVCDRVLKSRGCPYCAGQKPIKGKTDLKTLHPELMDEWDYEENLIGPENYTEKSEKKVHWICKKNGHKYITSICNRVKGSGCPYCNHKKPIKGENDLLTLYPDICKEWDYSKNNSTPDEYLPYSNKFAYWKCLKCGKSYKRRISSRVLVGNSCKCKK